MSRAEREDWILHEVLKGNVPDFLRALVPINASAIINGVPHSLVYYATPDYLAIGSDSDYFLQPATPLLGQRLADALGCTLPTRKMVNQIWTNAAVKLTPQPIPASAEMVTVPVFAQHNAMVRSQRDTFTNALPLGALVSGDKKDVIISTKIYTNFANPGIKPVVIYGWHWPNGDPIQSLYNGHEETYADYSHGIRLVQNAVMLDGLPTTITNLLTNAALAGLLSDEGVNEGTTNGVISKPRYIIAPLAPRVLTSPRSRTVIPGANVSFGVLVMSQAPVSYQWRWNGGAIPNATNSSLVFSNLAGAAAGFYSVLVTNGAGSAISRSALLQIFAPSHPVILFDDFETNAPESWAVFWGATNGIPDYTAEWPCDYGTLPSTWNGVTEFIPASPNSPDAIPHGLRFTVNNNDANACVAGVNAYNRDQLFAGDFAVKFDMWINYPGAAGGINATGSTQHAIFGIDHLGTQVNWAAPAATNSDGIWFAVDGEGGTFRDYQAYVGNPKGAPIELVGSAASGLAASNNAAPVYQALFPSSRFETAGSPGKQWVAVELRQTNKTVTWLMDGSVVAQRSNATSFVSGRIMLGLMDLFNSIANPGAEAFVLYDNVRVEDLSDRIRFLRVWRDESSRLHLVLSAVPGRDYRVDWSSDLAAWNELETQRGAGGPLHFMDPGSPLQPRRFYRARELPASP